ncbi:Ig-like domain-containing protein [Synechococcus sp. RS9916]|uniref:Ig-like domain-containing protein n=1 Tax=Synechococcus sp. RS9916 TaxID=221359 RepID=UPI0000E5406D|nr:Ig-like domain-containing protein [Synechococcus sp. RS9916]EAU73526.1 hypothetical protein RS9916_28494 [Synechococcus sp. RS9916]
MSFTQLDGTPPAFQSAATNTDGTKVILTYNEALSATTAAANAFTVTSGGVANAVTAVAVSGSTVELTVTRTIPSWHALTVAYADPSGSNDTNAVQDSQGNDAADLSSTSVTNNSTVQIVQRGSDIDGEAGDDQSGFSVSLSSDGSIVAIGARYNDGNGTASGHTRIYQWDSASSSWNQLGSDIDAEAAGDNSGYSVSLSSDGSVVAIGAHRNDGNRSDSGHTRIYKWDGSSWNQLGSDIDGEAFWDYSGYSVSLSSDGSTVAIGALNNHGNGSDSGHTRIYKWDGSSWNQRGSDIDGEAAFDYSGYSVSLSSDGSVLAIGAVFNDGNGSDAGHTRIYQWDGSSWNQLGSDIDGEAAGDYSGNVSLSSDGSIIAIGAYLNDGNGSNSGHTRIYKWDGSSWNQRGSDIDGEAALDYSGRSVSLSSDGSTVAIGAYLNDGNGSESGHTRIYQWDSASSSWNQVGSDIDGEAAGDRSGRSVSLSSDGSTVAIGATLNDGSAENAGHVRVFSLDTTAPTVQSVSSSTADGTYKAGDVITINVVFSEAVTVTTTGGTPQLTLETGSSDQNASYSSGSGTTTLAFSYTVQAGDTASDLNYKATSSLALNGGTIKDAAGNSATLTLPAVDGSDSLAGNSALVIDGAAPTIAVSSDVSSLKAGETATLSFTLSESSTNFEANDLTVSGGTLSNFSGSGTSYSATFTPTADSTTDGSISVASSKFSDAAGNTNADGSDANNSVSLSVDTVRPTFQSAASNTVGTKIILTYSETLSSTTAAIGTFSVNTASKDNPITDVAIAGSTAELTLTNTIKSGQAVTVAYTDPSSSDDANAIQDSTGNDAASLSSTSVTNNSTVASDSSDSGSSDSGSSDSGSNPSDTNTLVLNSDNSFNVTAGDTKGLWLKFNVKAASTKRQNCLKIIDQHGSVLGAIGATQDSKNLGSHAIFIPEGSTIAFHQFSNNQAINSSPQLNIIEQADGSFQLKLNDGVDDSDHDDLTIDITSFTSSPNASATSIAKEQTGIHDSILDLSSIPAAGETLQLTINSDCSFKNSIAMVKLTEETDGSFSVNGKTNADAKAFDQAVKDHLINPNGTSITATGVQTQTIDWTLSSADAGFYSPVLINPNGELYTYGSSYVKILGCNFFSFEDTHQNNSSDFDYNDVSILFQVI